MTRMERKTFKDIRWLYLIMTAAIMIGCAFPTHIAVPPTEYTKGIYNAVDAIKPGDIALIIWNVDPYQDATLAMDIVARHIIQKGGYEVWYVEAASTVPYMLFEMDQVYGVGWHNSPDYGKTFVCFGYIPVSEITLTNIARDASLVFKSDYFGTPASKLPMMANLHNGYDVKLIEGFPGAWNIIASIYAPYGTKYLHVENIGGLVGRIANYRAGQMSGILAGATGVAQYQTLTGIDEPMAWKYITPMLLLSVLATIGFIVPNVNYAISRSRGKQKVKEAA
jgi:hypothetical protein